MTGRCITCSGPGILHRYANTNMGVTDYLCYECAAVDRYDAVPVEIEPKEK